ncbi:MAG: methyltransferase domain-containing protein [Candidatus Lokiarchaeota archaeon]|nr:methyltransferase domain-containing protein [Candidatus Lokiarchaeota archaeon]
MEDFDIYAVSQGLKWLMRTFFKDLAKKEGLQKLLNEGKSFVQIVEEKGYKNLRLAEAFLSFLETENILVKENGKFSWVERPSKVKGKIILEEEARAQKMVQEHALPLFGILSKYAQKLPEVLRGYDSHRDAELVIWDSLSETEFYNYLRYQAIIYGDLPKDAILLDIGCKTGWSSINLVEMLNPKKVYALESDEIMVELAYENALAQGFSDRIEFIVKNFLDEKSFLELDIKADGGFFNLFFNNYTDEQMADILYNIRTLLKTDAKIVGLQPIKDSEAITPAELLLYADKEFRGYPEYTNFKNSFVRAGFTPPQIENSMYFQTTFEMEIAKERRPKKKGKK